ncbi:hypothetical protein GE061_003082 [Apolygus lucorum]|uniref:Uncharacterized protein n=1 Tax=Apolygus lucorum TaxID=248454 RepID=A0A6A4JS09_APOLU|nr:hypothetical protein GE061_003082 [Apolygus lucorum]
MELAEPHAGDIVGRLLIILLFIHTATGLEALFHYRRLEPHDPANVALLRESLRRQGINPKGIKLKSFWYMNEIYRSSYKATFRNRFGRLCFWEWTVALKLIAGSHDKMKIVLILLMALGLSESNLPFTYLEADANDPENVAALRQALMVVGYDPNGIKVLSFFIKYDIIRTSYKATYLNQQLQRCFLKWRVRIILGTQVPRMPVCDRSAIGDGSNYPVIVDRPSSGVIIVPTYRPPVTVPTVRCRICAGL